MPRLPWKLEAPGKVNVASWSANERLLDCAGLCTVVACREQDSRQHVSRVERRDLGEVVLVEHMHDCAAGAAAQVGIAVGVKHPCKLQVLEVACRAGDGHLMDEVFRVGACHQHRHLHLDALRRGRPAPLDLLARRHGALRKGAPDVEHLVKAGARGRADRVTEVGEPVVPRLGAVGVGAAVLAVVAVLDLLVAVTVGRRQRPAGADRKRAHVVERLAGLRVGGAPVALVVKHVGLERVPGPACAFDVPLRRAIRAAVVQAECKLLANRAERGDILRGARGLPDGLEARHVERLHHYFARGQVGLRHAADVLDIALAGVAHAAALPGRKEGRGGKRAHGQAFADVHQAGAHLEVGRHALHDALPVGAALAPRDVVKADEVGGHLVQRKELRAVLLRNVGARVGVERAHLKLHKAAVEAGRVSRVFQQEAEVDAIYNARRCGLVAQPGALPAVHTLAWVEHILRQASIARLGSDAVQLAARHARPVAVLRKARGLHRAVHALLALGGVVVGHAA
eukprot:365889-Chlamydomonas_euryale.AAC.5